LDYIFAICGLLLLIIAGDYLVRGASALGLRKGLSPAFIGFSIIGFGTSAPELLVSIDALIVLLLVSIRFYKKSKIEPSDKMLDIELFSSRKTWFFLISGLIGLPIGAHLLVIGASNIADSFGVSDAVIGLTVVAVGTSLPELMASISAAMRKQGDLLIGNIIGSNTMNILCVAGTTAVISPIPVDQTMAQFDGSVMILVSLILIPFILFHKKFTRLMGLMMLAIYGGFIVFTFML